MDKVASVGELAIRVAREPELAKRVAADPAKTLFELAGPLQTDVWIYRIVVGALAVALIVSGVGAIILSLLAKTIPDVLVALGSAAIGALAGLLAPSPTSR